MTRRGFLRQLVFAGGAVMLAAAVPDAVFAVDLDQAKAAGLVGEKPDGYLGVVGDGAGADVQALAQKINSERRAHYDAIARKNGTSLAAVEALAGQKAIERTPSGQFVFVPGRGWVKKP